MTLELNNPVPDFALADLRGRMKKLSLARGRIAVVYYWSARCDWCRRVDPYLARFSAEWGDRVTLIPIATDPADARDEWADAARELRLPVLLVDPGARITRAFGATVTPSFFVLDSEGVLRYRGAFDDVTFRKRNPEQHYLKDAVDALLRGEVPAVQETQAYGCAI